MWLWTERTGEAGDAFGISGDKVCGVSEERVLVTVVIVEVLETLADKELGASVGARLETIAEAADRVGRMPSGRRFRGSGAA